MFILVSEVSKDIRGHEMCEISSAKTATSLVLIVRVYVKKKLCVFNQPYLNLNPMCILTLPLQKAVYL